MTDDHHRHHRHHRHHHRHRGDTDTPPTMSTDNHQSTDEQHRPHPLATSTYAIGDQRENSMRIRSLESATLTGSQPDEAVMPPAYDLGEPRDWRDTPPPYDDPGESTLEFATNFGVHEGLLPWSDWSINIFALIAETRRYIDTLPGTKASYRAKELGDAIGLCGARAVHTHVPLLLAGSWELPERARGNIKRYANPHYVHARNHAPLTDPETRLVQLALLSRFGPLLDTETIAPRFGWAPSTVHTFARDYDIPLQAWRDAGTRLVARTLHTAHVWGFTHGELARVFAFPSPRAVRALIDRHSRAHGYVPFPLDPTLQTCERPAWNRERAAIRRANRGSHAVTVAHLPGEYDDPLWNALGVSDLACVGIEDAPADAQAAAPHDIAPLPEAPASLLPAGLEVA